MKALAGFLICMLLTVSVYGQTTNGSIQGTVTDSSGATLSRATVTARNLDTGLTNSTVTTDAGLYSLPNLPPGRYSVKVEATGMKKYEREGVTVQTGSTVSLDIEMQIGSVTETITVNADASQLETATSDTREIETPSTSTSVPPSWPPFTLKSSVALSAGLLPTIPTNPGTSVMNCKGLR